MAKRKEKKIPFDNTAIEVTPGVWEWSIGEIVFRWSNDLRGPNFHFKIEEFQSMIFVKNINDAALFAEGLYAGIRFSAQLKEWPCSAE